MVLRRSLTTRAASRIRLSGPIALYGNTTGGANTAVGFGAGLGGNGGGHTAIGVDALLGNVTGGSNTAVGVMALFNHHTGDNNTAIGTAAFKNNDSGDGNIALGAGAGSGINAASNVICIGANVAGDNVSNSCFIGNIFNATSSGGTAVFVNSNGQLGITTSSRRFKDDIHSMDKASEALFSLKPVTFRYKKEIDPAGTSQFGLIAEEVAAVNPDLVVRDKNGEIYSVRYDQVNAMLLNEFLKEHRKNEEQQATIAQLKSGMEALTATVKEQAAQIQKVSAQLEANKPTPQVVANDQ
jgi:trimeric autotransporter adhesin